MKKFLSLISLILCISLLCCVLSSCGSEKSDEVTKEEWYSALSLSTNMNAKFVETYEEYEDGDVYKTKFTADLTYKNGVLTADLVGEVTDNGETEKDTATRTITESGITVGMLISEYTEEGRYYYNSLSYGDFEYNGECYIYTKTQDEANLEIKVYFKDGRLTKVIGSANETYEDESERYYVEYTFSY